MRPAAPRIPQRSSFDASRGRRELKINAAGRHALRYGTEDLDLRGLEQIVDPSQTRAIGHAIHLAAERWMDGETSLAEILDLLERHFDSEGLDALDPFHRPGQHPGAYARPRRFEIAGALNRLRSLRVRSADTLTPGAPETRAGGKR